MAEHHREEAQAPPLVAHPNRPCRPPVHLRTLAWRKVQRQIRRGARRTHRPHIVFQDTVASSVALLLQPLEELDCAVGIRVQEPHDDALIRIQLTPTRLLRVSPPFVFWATKPFAHGRSLDRERSSNLRDAQFVVLSQVPERLFLRSRATERCSR